MLFSAKMSQIQNFVAVQRKSPEGHAFRGLGFLLGDAVQNLLVLMDAGDAAGLGGGQARGSAGKGHNFAQFFLVQGFGSLAGLLWQQIIDSDLNMPY